MTILVSFDPATSEVYRYDSKLRREVVRAGVKPPPVATHNMVLVEGRVPFDRLIASIFHNPPPSYSL